MYKIRIKSRYKICTRSELKVGIKYVQDQQNESE